MLFQIVCLDYYHIIIIDLVGGKIVNSNITTMILLLLTSKRTMPDRSLITTLRDRAPARPLSMRNE